MRLEINLRNLPDTKEGWMSELRVTGHTDLGGGSVPTDIVLTGDNNALAIVSRMFNTLRDPQKAERVLNYLVEIGHMLEGFQCPRCAMNAMGRTDP